jgi:hypothetical protein
MKSQFRPLTIEERFFKASVVINSVSGLPPAMQTLPHGGMIPKSAPTPDMPASGLSQPFFTPPLFSEKVAKFFKNYWPHMFLGGLAIGIIVVLAYPIKKDENNNQEKAK